MSDQLDKPGQPENPSDSQERLSPRGDAQTITLDGTSYQVSPTAFRSHYQVVASDGTLVGLIEMVDVGNTVEFRARPASGAGMTQSLMVMIAEAALRSGMLK